MCEGGGWLLAAAWCQFWAPKLMLRGRGAALRASPLAACATASGAPLQGPVCRMATVPVDSAVHQTACKDEWSAVSCAATHSRGRCQVVLLLHVPMQSSGLAVGLVGCAQLWQCSAGACLQHACLLVSGSCAPWCASYHGGRLAAARYSVGPGAGQLLLRPAEQGSLAAGACASLGMQCGSRRRMSTSWS